MNISYYALFSISECGKFIEINFPDLIGCQTYYPKSDNYHEKMGDLMEFAKDCLYKWINYADEKFIKPPSTYEEIGRLNTTNSLIVVISIDNNDKVVRDYYGAC